MDLEEALTSLELRDSLELFQPHWEKSAARRVREDPTLLCLAWHCYRLLISLAACEVGEFVRSPAVRRSREGV